MHVRGRLQRLEKRAGTGRVSVWDALAMPAEEVDGLIRRGLLDLEALSDADLGNLIAMLRQQVQEAPCAI